jgi:uncharacterized protein YecE (DUF72 family)
MRLMEVLSGTSGYSYKEWKGNFYPEDLPAAKMLRFYGERFPAVEINNTFYRMPEEKILRQWREQVPARFRFALKAPQRITHRKRLADTDDDVKFLFQTAEVLGETLGPILFQLPPYSRCDLPLLMDFLSLLPVNRKAAFEFRHESWFSEPVFSELRRHGAALCIADTDETENPQIVSTTSWGYLRLRRTEYREADLQKWADRVTSQSWTTAYVFFKHEDEGKGPQYAEQFRTFLPS